MYRNESGYTPLHEAARMGHEQICNLFHERVVDKNPISKSGLTTLHHAAKNGHFNVCYLNQQKKEILILFFRSGFFNFSLS